MIIRFRKRVSRWILLAILAPVPSSAEAQSIIFDTTPKLSEPSVIQDLLASQHFEPETVRQTSTPRLRMFGMPAGFLSAPVAPEDEEDTRINTELAIMGINTRDDDFKNVQVSLGMDNPYFDQRRPGSVGGVGYYQIYSQVQMLDTGLTSMCLNLQAYTPAGLQWGGLANGPTYLCPALSVFHDLGKGNALQGFVSQNVCAGAGWDDNLNRKMFYGVAWQTPVRALGDDVYFFVQGLGRMDYDPSHDAIHRNVFVMPGLQWRMADNCWLSVGGGAHGLISCSWQF